MVAVSVKIYICMSGFDILILRLLWQEKGSGQMNQLDLLMCMFPGGSDGKASVYNVGDLGSIPGSGRSPGEGNGNSL